MIHLGKQNILGVGVDAIDYDAAVAQIVAAAKGGRPLAVTALAVHGVMTGVLDPAHRHRLNAFDLVCPDGQPVRWALRWLHDARLTDRVYGPNLMLKTCAAAAEHDLPIYLYGGTDSMIAALRTRLTQRFPALQIAGASASRFRRLDEAERDAVAENIRTSGARVTFVGLGCPRQEVFAYEMRERLAMPLVAVGAAFPFHAGQLAQAPPWLQRRGLEWLYRLLKEPRRLWKRYLYLNPLYLTLLAAQRTGLSIFETTDGRPPSGELRYG